MGKAELQRDLQALYSRAQGNMALSALMDEICSMLARHADTLRGVNGRYRLTASDTGYTCAFALEDGVYRGLDGAAPRGRGHSGPRGRPAARIPGRAVAMSALFQGKVRVQGSKAALMRLAGFL